MPNNLLQLVFFVVFSTCSSTLLWRIETYPPSYLFGTIHIPHNFVWPYVSNETRQAFLSSTHVYAEIDAKNDAYWDDFLRCLVNKSTRPQRSIKSVREAELLDIYLSSEARRLNKTVGSLETAEYHCEKESWRYNLSTWIIILNYVKKEMKNQTFSNYETKDYLTELTIKKYICDDIDSQYIQTLFKSKNEIQHLEHRDEQISRHIHRLLHPPTTNRYFFAVGAAHLLGKHQNLIIQLKSFGYKITRICTDRNRMKKKSGCKKKKIMKHCIKKKS